MEQLKDWWHWIVVVFAAGGFTWQSRNIKSRMDKHDQLHKDARFVTQDALDRTQSNCQQLLFNEISHVKELMADIKEELKLMRGK